MCFCILKFTEDFSTGTDPHAEPYPHLDLLIRGPDLRIRIQIRTKTELWIRIRVGPH